MFVEERVKRLGIEYYTYKGVSGLRQGSCRRGYEGLAGLFEMVTRWL
jgi:hypothetical protein